MIEPTADIVLAKGGNENESAPLYDHWLPGIYCRLLYCPVLQSHHLRGAGSAPDPAKEPARHPTGKVISSVRGLGTLAFGRQVTGAWPGSC